MKGRDNIKERIRMFRFVRDIPYYISTGEEQDYSCATKPFILDKLLKSIGLKVNHVLFTFKWEKLGLDKDLLSLPHDPKETHEYLLVYVPENNTWVKVDPTWDSRIQHPSISIPKWDGISDTTIAVPIEREWSPEESKKLIAEEDNISEEERQEYLKKNRQFLVAFNRWLESQRSSI